MNLGVSTACYYPMETELALEEACKTGAGHTEIFFNARSELKNSFIDILLDIKSRYGIQVDSIHPTMSLAESFMIFSAYDRRFYEAIDDFSRYSEIAARLGAKYIILHGGKPNGILNDEEYCQRYMALKEATLKNGVTLLQENVAKYRSGEIEFLRSMKEILGRDAEFCIDIKQAVRCGYNPMDLILEFFENTRHYHISDHSIASDCQLPLSGGFDFKGMFNLLKEKDFNGSCIIELYRSSYKEYPEIKDAFIKLLSQTVSESDINVHK